MNAENVIILIFSSSMQNLQISILVICTLLMILVVARPKSPILTWSLESKNMLTGFRSLWIIPFEKNQIFWHSDIHTSTCVCIMLLWEVTNFFMDMFKSHQNKQYIKHGTKVNDSFMDVNTIHNFSDLKNLANNAKIRSSLTLLLVG